MPDWLRRLTRLEHLVWRGTDTTQLPAWIGELRALRTLRVENCPLTSLPPELSELAQLRRLGMCDTWIERLNPESLPGGLQEIDLAGSRHLAPRSLPQLRQALPRMRIRGVG